MKIKIRPAGSIVLICLLAAPCLAQTETTTITYDALGRVIAVESVRSAETIDFDFSYDDADNRTQQVITEQTTAAIEPQNDPAPQNDSVESLADISVTVDTGKPEE